MCETLLSTVNKESYAYKYNIEQMNAVLFGADCAVKFVGKCFVMLSFHYLSFQFLLLIFISKTILFYTFTANNHNSGEAFNMLGMLLERQGIYNASLKAYETYGIYLFCVRIYFVIFYALHFFNSVLEPYNF